MKIAQVPPLYESVPPKLYGGTERVVSYLTEALIDLGNDVTLFGTADSVTQAKLFSICKQGLRLNKHCKDPLAWHVYQMRQVMDLAHEFDIIHFHNDYLHYPFSKNCNYAHITTLHGRLDLEDLKPIYRVFDQIPLVSISDNQRKPFDKVQWVKTIYHGLPKNLYKPGKGEGNYLAFLGRISPEKRPDRAIEIAKKSGMPLKIAAKVDQQDLHYFKEIIHPLLDHPLIEFIGEIGEREKEAFLGQAAALLFPIDWPEPFGMVMIEAMANGTPVIAFNCGSVPEVIDEGKTGFIVNSTEEALKAVAKLQLFDRQQCRRVFEQRFSAEIMAKNYVGVYRQLIREKEKVEITENLSLESI